MTTKNRGNEHLKLARESLTELLRDRRVPEEVRTELARDYAELKQMLRKLEQEEVHIAAFGRVGVGKSALLNALLNEHRFPTSPLHGTTRAAVERCWQKVREGNVLLIDTPGINEVAGEERAEIAERIAGRVDLVLFVVDGDLTDTELTALKVILARQLPVILVFNKIDRYTDEEVEMIVASIRQNTAGLIGDKDLVLAQAAPMPERLLRLDTEGHEQESLCQPMSDVSQVTRRLLEILETEGKSLAAVNAGLFASELGDQIGRRILETRRHLGEKLIRTYCIAKGIAVALNPVPVSDLIAALVVDVSMLIHLSKLYALPLSRNEAGDLIKVIGAQMALLMGGVWLVHIFSSLLKLGSGGFSALITGTAQGALAYYTTYIVGRAAEHYLARGKSWGEGGPKLVVQEILDGIDKDTLLAEAKEEIRMRLKQGVQLSRT